MANSTASRQTAPVTKENEARIRRESALLFRDYEEIDESFLGKTLRDARRLQDPRPDVAPAQGSQFLDDTPSTYNILRRFAIRFRF